MTSSRWSTASTDKERVERVPYDLCVLVALRDAVRRREIWVVGANRWRNPEDGLRAIFEDNRYVHDAALGQPQDAGEFITALQGKLRTSLVSLRAGARGGHDGRGGDREETRRAVDSPLPAR
ncbi:hypothetical protein [Streptomyces sp. NPDC003015]